jgi:hypothetical protein
MSLILKSSQDGTKAIVGIDGGEQLKLSSNGDLEIAGKIKSQSGAALTSDSPLVVDVDSTAPALRVTQTGSGNAIVVEDSTNPDATPFIVNSSGNVQLGKDTLNPTVAINDRFTVVSQTTAANPFEGGLGVSFIMNHNRTSSGSTLKLIKTKGTHDNPAATILGEEIGAISFLGYDGNRIQPVARVRCNGDTTTLPNPLLSSCPGYLWFETTPAASAIPVERMRIASNGNVGIGTKTPQAKLSVQGGSIYLNDGLNNVGIGDNVLANNTTGSYNTASGHAALRYNTTGTNNTASGQTVLNDNTTGSYNTASGNAALYSNTTGNFNTASGNGALYLNTTGTNNTASGSGALRSNTTGTHNTASGHAALYSNIIGNNNTAVGLQALYNNLSSSNVAVGMNALYNNDVGSYNTSIGRDALDSLVNYANCTGLGNNANVTASNQIQLGNSSTTTYVYGTVQNRSDIRDKTDVRDTTLGLEFISALRPVDFKWDMREDYRPEAPKFVATPSKLEEDASDEEKAKYAEELAAYNAYKVELDKWLEDVKLANITHDGSKKRSRFHHGLIAQEVKAVLDAKGIDFGGFQDHSVKGGDDVLSIGYEELVAPLIKSVQELSEQNKQLQTRIESLENK